MANPTSELRLELQIAGSNDNTWGAIANVNFRLIEDAISGLKEIATTGGTVTLTTVNASADYASSEDQARYAALKITGVLSSNSTIVVPASSKIYHVWNATSGAYTLTVKVSGSTGVVVTQDKRAILLCDGAEVYAAYTDTGTVGDCSTNTASSVDSELALFSGVGGKTIKRATTTGVLKATSGVVAAASANVDYATPNLSINDQTGTTYTFVLGDAAKYVRFNNVAAISATIPPNSSVAFPTGTQIHLRQVSTGQLSVVAGSGVTINTPETLKLRAAKSTATIIKVATDTWDLLGDLEEL
jgi:hypothetical protein